MLSKFILICSTAYKLRCSAGPFSVVVGGNPMVKFLVSGASIAIGRSGTSSDYVILHWMVRCVFDIQSLLGLRVA